MFKKIQDWIFKEEVEELIIEEEETYQKDEYEFVKEPVIREEKRKEQPVFEAYVEPIPKASIPKMNIDIKVDEPIVEKKSVHKHKEVVKPTLIRREDYEMPPVISPYFGVKGDKNVESERSTLNQFPSSENKKETFNSVISPFYGKTASQKPIQETRSEPKKILEETISSDPILSREVESISELEEDNLSLDEIVSVNVENDDDLIQFSLFGENKKIHDNFENEDTEDDDLLPF